MREMADGGDERGGRWKTLGTTDGRRSVCEVATRRKVTELRMTGEDEQCPSIVLMGSTRMIYSEVDDRQHVDALTRHVEQ